MHHEHFCPPPLIIDLLTPCDTAKEKVGDVCDDEKSNGSERDSDDEMLILLNRKLTHGCTIRGECGRAFMVSSRESRSEGREAIEPHSNDDEKGNVIKETLCGYSTCSSRVAVGVFNRFAFSCTHCFKR